MHSVSLVTAWLTLASLLSFACAADGVEDLKAKAEKGDPEAQIALGDLDSKGQDFASAVKWYRKAADQGHAKAQEHVGLAYYHGEGVAQDYEQAAQWFLKAAKQGYAEAQANLGACFHYGEGVTQDYEQAAQWFLKAAQQGHPRAQLALGMAYLHGAGLPVDSSQALVWLDKAADQSEPEALHQLSLLYIGGKSVPQDTGKGFELMRRAAKSGLAKAQFGVACLLAALAENEDDNYKSEALSKSAREMLLLAAGQGYEDAKPFTDLPEKRALSDMAHIGKSVLLGAGRPPPTSAAQATTDLPREQPKFGNHSAQHGTPQLPSTLTADGTTYSNVTYSSHDATSVSFLHSTGVAKIPLESLPADVRHGLPVESKPAEAVFGQAIGMTPSEIKDDGDALYSSSSTPCSVKEYEYDKAPIVEVSNEVVLQMKIYDSGAVIFKVSNQDSTKLKRFDNPYRSGPSGVGVDLNSVQASKWPYSGNFQVNKDQRAAVRGMLSTFLDWHSKAQQEDLRDIERRVGTLGSDELTYVRDEMGNSYLAFRASDGRYSFAPTSARGPSNMTCTIFPQTAVDIVAMLQKAEELDRRSASEGAKKDAAQKRADELFGTPPLP
jgi:TPR repeat protein